MVGPGDAAAQRLLGVDVSSYQGSADSPPTNIVWGLVKSNGFSFAWTKATEGTGYIDADFVYNETHAKAAGVLIGAYHYARPDLHLGTSGADAEAAYFWNEVKDYATGGGAYLMPMLDFEQNVSGVSPAYTQATLSAWVNEWCQDIVNYGAANGVTVRPVVYTFTSYATGTAGYGPGLNSSVTNWPLWMAQYPGGNVNTQNGAPSSITPWPGWNFWQYSSTNIIAGIEGRTDADVFNGTSNTIGSFVIGGPGISNQPVSVTVPVGANATFSVTASGGGTLYYQWKFNSTNISAATNSQYTINNVQLANAGGYSVLVTNTVGGILSATAFLSVQALLTNAAGSVLAPPGLVNWWTADGNASDIYGGANGSPQGLLTYGPGEDNLAFHLDGSTALITTGAAADLPVPWTVCMWVNRQNSPQVSAGLLEDGTYSLKLEQYNGTHQVGLSVLSVGDYIFSPPYTVPPGTWTHLAFVGTSAGTTLYANGVLKGSLTNSIPLPRHYIGAGYITSSAKYVDFMLGSLDEIMTFNRALSGTEINSIYTAGGAGLIRAPAFTSFSLAGGAFQMSLEGLTGKTFTIHSSPDLMNWTTLGTILNPNGTNQFLDVTATNAQTFYRVSQP